jgi:hypothetical protein
MNFAGTPVAASARLVRQHRDVEHACPATGSGRALGAANRQRPGVVLARELAHQHVGQAHAALGHVLAQLLVEHRREHLRLLAVRQPVLGRGVAHALHHLVDEQRLELLGRTARRIGRAGLGRTLQVAEALGVEREAAGDVGFRRSH